MSLTYLELVNKVLLRLNEVPLTQDTFSSARGLHATVKEAVKDTVSKIHKVHPTWPFDAAQHTQPLQVGEEEHAWPINLRLVDWQSFQINKDDSLNTLTIPLKKIARNEWYGYQKSRDLDAKPDGLRVPRYVFDAHGRGFGVTPSPDQEYGITYRYWLKAPELSGWDDETTIPREYDYVIASGALWLMKLFKADAEQANILKTEFNDNLKGMKRTAFNLDVSMRDTRVPRR